MARVIAVLAVAAASLVFAAPVGAASPTQAILILNESGPGTSGYVAVTVALRTALNRIHPDSEVPIYSENLDFSRFDGPQYQNLLSAYIQRKYSEKPISAVVPIGSGALEFALRLRADQRPGVPIVFITGEPADASRLPQAPELTGVVVRSSLRDYARMARALVPDLKRLVLIGDRLEHQMFERNFAEEIPTLDLEIVDLLGAPMRELRETRFGAAIRCRDRLSRDHHR